MKPGPVVFWVPFGPGTKHRVQVRLYRTKAAMVTASNWLFGPKSVDRHTLAACGGPIVDMDDRTHVATLVFNRPHLLCRYLVHECVHAARRRAELLAIADEREAEESEAEDVEALSANVLSEFRARRILR